MKVMFMSVRRRLSAIAGTGMVLALVALVGTALMGTAEGMDELLPHAVVLWKSTVYETLGDPVTVLGVGDVTGDGILDIVGGLPTTILVFAGQGNGRFSEMPFWGAYEIEPHPSGRGFRPAGKFWPICGDLADLDGDGALDLVVGVIDENAHVARIYVFRNTWGAFVERTVSLDLPFKIAEEHLPLYKLWARDLDGDGIVDLVLSGGEAESRGLYFLAGKGEFVWGPLTLAASVQGNPLCLADLDQDGFLDFGSYTEDGVHVLFGDGRGGFPFEASFTPELGEGRVYEAGIGDVDGDGDQDIVLITTKGMMVVIQKGRAFRLGQVLDAQRAANLIVADFTGDGVADALVGKQGTWRLLPGDGQGGFLGVASEHLLFLFQPTSVDLNGDGRFDLISTWGYSLEAYINDGLPKGESRTPFEGNALLAVGDLTGNGAADLLVAGKDFLEVLWNNGRGGLVRSRLFQGKLNPVWVEIAGGQSYLLNVTRRIKPDQEWRAVLVGELWVLGKDGEVLARHELGEDPAPAFAAGDLDGDGVLDVLALGKREIIVLWGGDEVERFPWEQGELSLAWAGDLDGDGLAEAAVVSTAEYADVYLLSLSNRDLTVSGPVLELASVPLALSGGDLDGDGVADLVVLSLVFAEEEGKVKTTAGLGLLLSRLGPKDIAIPDFLVGDSPWPLTGLAVGDFTGDGLGDVACSLVSGRGAYMLPGRGDGTFCEPKQFAIGVGPIFAADLDGNGQDDLVASTTGLAPHLLILWNGGE